MPFPNIFKKSEKKKEVKKVLETKPTVVRSNMKEVEATQGNKVSFGGISAKVLVRPHITEKASFLAENNQYVFRVSRNATKYAIKKAIKETFGADATHVNVITISPKKVRVGKTLGTKPGYKKAIITVKKGQKIEVMPR